MPIQVVNGASIACSLGSVPGTLGVLPLYRTSSNDQPHATMLDHLPSINIASFGMCNSPTNPQVIAATSAAMGVLTPQPCLPMTLLPWVPGASNVQFGAMLALDDTSQCNCVSGGTIRVTAPGQTRTQIP